MTRQFACAEAVRSLRSVIDVMDGRGIAAYRTNGCGRTCQLAVRTRRPRVVNEAGAGAFARPWVQESAPGMPPVRPPPPGWEYFTLTRDMLFDRHKISPSVGRMFRRVVRRTVFRRTTVRGNTVFRDGKLVGSFRGRLVTPARKAAGHA